MFMQDAIEVSLQTKNEIPIGAVIVKGGEIIAFAHNKKEELQDVTAHAEILAIKMAQEGLRRWRLNDCDMYVTLEPCLGRPTMPAFNAISLILLCFQVPSPRARGCCS